MPSQNEPAGTTPPRPGAESSMRVRRAVSLPAPAADPGGTLPAAAPAPASTGGREGAEQPTAITGPTAAAPDAAQAAPADGSRSAQAARDADADAEGEGAAAAGLAAADPGSPADGEAGHPGSPRKPILAGAAIAGVVLLAVPFLLIDRGDDDEPARDKRDTALDTTLANERTAPPAGRYTVGSPTARPSKSASTSPKPSKKPSKKPAPARTTEKAAAPAPTVTTTKTVKPPRPAPDPFAGTAGAAAVNLQKVSPGRHVCYRLYVESAGWQSPKCDGAQASGSGHAILAIQISMSGTSGGSANAFLEQTGWQPEWKGAEDGKNFLIGRTSGSTPLVGLAMSVDSGNRCASVKAMGQDWGNESCQQDTFVFAGNPDTAATPLEAVTFRV